MKRHLIALAGVVGLAFVTPCAWGSALDSVQVCRRLTTLQGQIPLPYHPTLMEDIKDCMARPLPAEFTQYDSLLSQEIRRNKLPEELRYLPLALTGMNPNHFRDGRAGIWDLPVLPALRYGLTVNEQHDERYAVEASTRAALQYLSDLYAATGNWWDCLLAYTNSPATVNRAQARHPGSKVVPWDYADKNWLPNTDVIGDFIACYYVYSDNKAVTPADEEVVTCDFDQPVSVAVLSSHTDLPKKILLMLNPLFRSDPFLPKEGYGLRLPKTVQARFEASREKIYAETALLNDKKVEEEAQLAEKQEKAKEQAKAQAQQTLKSITYVVKSGDTLNKIAKKYHVKVSDLKKWNKLKGDMIREKQKLKIYQ